MQVEVLPAGVVLDVTDGETVFAAAARHRFSWPTTCGGLADCGNCIAKVTGGLEHCVPAAELERETIGRVRPGRLGADPSFRLACQLTVTGPVTLVKRGVRPR